MIRPVCTNGLNKKKIFAKFLAKDVKFYCLKLKNLKVSHILTVLHIPFPNTYVTSLKKNFFAHENSFKTLLSGHFLCAQYMSIWSDRGESHVLFSSITDLITILFPFSNEKHWPSKYQFIYTWKMYEKPYYKFPHGHSHSILPCLFYESS